MDYSDNQLTKLARENPKELAKLLANPNLNVRTLSFGAEILGEEVKDEVLVLPVFRMLLRHINAIVREGACIGMSCFYIDKKPPLDVLQKLQDMKNNDPSPAIKECAIGLIENFEKI